MDYMHNINHIWIPQYVNLGIQPGRDQKANTAHLVGNRHFAYRWITRLFSRAISACRNRAPARRPFSVVGCLAKIIRQSNLNVDTRPIVRQR